MKNRRVNAHGTVKASAGKEASRSRAAPRCWRSMENLLRFRRTDAPQPPESFSHGLREPAPHSSAGRAPSPNRCWSQASHRWTQTAQDTDMVRRSWPGG